MFVGHYHFLLEVVYLLLLKLSHLLNHVVARDEHCVEEARVGEGVHILDFALEVYLAIICWSVLLALQFSLLIHLLFHIGDAEIILRSWMWLLWMCIVIGLLHVDIEAALSLPLGLILLLLFNFNLVLINQRE